MKKYPVISGVVSVKDLFSELLGHSSVLGKNYVVKLTSEECLSDVDMIKIDEDIKTLFTMMHSSIVVMVKDLYSNHLWVITTNQFHFS